VVLEIIASFQKIMLVLSMKKYGTFHEYVSSAYAY